LRKSFIKFAKKLDVRKLVFLDEAGSHIAMAREYGRAPIGERVRGSVPRNRGVVTTMLGALDYKGVRAMMSVEGATDAEVFEIFLRKVLAPKLRPGDIVILDNVGAHKPEAARQIIEDRGASLLFLPPYSPDLNPIEPCWGKLKGILKDIGARTREALDEAIGRALNMIVPADARGWFEHCGYRAHAE